MKVLLARPHDFLVETMTATLLKLGLEPVRLTGLDALPALPRHEFSGAIISLAASSSVRESMGEVYTAVRRAWPTRPIVFTGLSSLASARLGLTGELPGVRFTVVGLHETPSDRVDEHLYLAEADLKRAPAQVEAALRVKLRLAAAR